MKKVILFLALSMATMSTITSCSRDNDSKTVTDNYSITPKKVTLKYDAKQ